MKKILKGLAAAGIALTLGACSSSDAANDSAADSTTTENGDLTVLKVGATSSPHAQILEYVKDTMKEKGYDLQITEFSDYPTINPAVVDGSLDANYFQHQPYLDSFNSDSGYVEGDGNYLVSAGAIHYEPFGIYSDTLKSLDELKEGDKVAVPNDPSNEARALILLQENGLLTLKEGVDLNTATAADITDSTVEIVELPADQIAANLPDVAAAVINGNYALAGNVTDKRIAYEAPDSDAAKTYQNVVAVKETNKDNEAITTLVEVLKSQDTKDYIEENFGEWVIPAE